MKRTSSRLLLAALIATASTLALAQPMQGGGGMDPAAMQQRRAEHLAELKAQLQLTPQQEAAWTAFTTAMQPPDPSMRLTPAERSQLTDAQRAERRQQMQELREQRKEAVETFRAQLTPDQQQVFDQHTARMKGHRRGGMKGGMSGN
jgi:Spy/CpxP family protein refolding chaperone